MFLSVSIWPQLIESSIQTQGRGDREKGMTVVIQTFRRNACLSQAVKHWRTCKIVKEIAVSWGDTENEPPAFLKGCSVFKTENRLSARFTPQRFQTDALFSVDDDVVYACSDLERAFAKWLTRQDDMVGFVPRHVPDCKGYVWNRHYFDKKFNLILATKGALLHKKYYEIISSKVDDDVVTARKFTDSLINSDDLLMAFVFARTRGVGEGWIAVQPKLIKDLECGLGLSSGADHVSKRIKTFERLQQIFGACPFVSMNLDWK